MQGKNENKLRKNMTNIYNEERNFILIIKGAVKEEKKGLKKKVYPPFSFFLFSFSQ